MTARVITLLCAAAICGGCLDIQQSLTLNRDLSGTAGFSMKVDLEPVAILMARMSREMAGKTGDPTPDELARVRQEFASRNSDTPAEFETQKRQLAASLPAGVRLLDATMTEQGFGMAATMAFAFDDVSRLSEIRLPKTSKKKDDNAMPGDLPVDAPFNDLKVTDEGATILVTGPPQNPVKGSKDQAPPDAEAQKMLKDVLKGVRVAYRITSPMEVVSHNAHKKVGDTLVWEYDLKSLEKMKPSEINSSIKVRYRK